MNLSEYLKDRGAGKSLAAAINISGATLSEWKSGKKKVPAARCIDIEVATAGVVRCEDMRPDLNWKFVRALESGDVEKSGDVVRVHRAGIDKDLAASAPECHCGSCGRSVNPL